MIQVAHPGVALASPNNDQYYVNVKPGLQWNHHGHSHVPLPQRRRAVILRAIKRQIKCNTFAAYAGASYTKGNQNTGTDLTSTIGMACSDYGGIEGPSTGTPGVNNPMTKPSIRPPPAA